MMGLGENLPIFLFQDLSWIIVTHVWEINFTNTFPNSPAVTTMTTQLEIEHAFEKGMNLIHPAPLHPVKSNYVPFDQGGSK